MKNEIDYSQLINYPIANSIALKFALEVTQTRPSVNIAYHYTDINGFLGLMNSREWWLSNVNFMNDRSEVSDGISVFRHEIVKCMKRELPKDQQYCLERVDNLLSYGKSDGSWAIDKSDIYAMCFCTEGDLLTQWKSYGDDGAGISIGFDLQKLFRSRLMPLNLYNEDIAKGISPDEMLPHDEALPMLQQAVYDVDIKIEIAAHIINSLLEDTKKLMKDEHYDVSLNMLCSEYTDVIYRYISIFKNESFFSELELRYVYSVFINSKKLAIDFRQRKGYLLPFLKFKLLDVNCRPLFELPISDIVVGPSAKQADLLNSIKYFLRESGNSTLEKTLRLSNIPYRG